MDRKNYDIIKQIKRNAENLQDFKATQFTGGDSVNLKLVSTTNTYDWTQVIAPNQLCQFYFQLDTNNAIDLDDAEYEVGVINLYVDTPPPAGTRYAGNSSSGLTVGTSPMLFIGTNSVGYLDGLWWSISVRNIDSVNHTVYSKGFVLTSREVSNIAGIGWGVNI